MSKLYTLIGIISILFITFIIILLVPKNYQLNYEVKNIAVAEEYIKKYRGYYFVVKYEDVNYPLFINKKYFKTRKLVKDITINKLNNEICLNVKIANKIYYLCSEQSIKKDYRTMSKEFINLYFLDTEILEKVESSYEKIDIYNYNNNQFLIWNYKGFINISNENKDKINIFTKDNYKNSLSYQTSKCLIFPDYDSDYYFKKIYIYNAKENILNDINFDFEISFDSYFLGAIKDKIYLLDKKNKKEYEIDLKKNNIKLIADETKKAKFYKEAKWTEVSFVKIINEELKFVGEDIYTYELENNTLYLNIKNEKIKVSNNKVKKLVYQNEENVYYLVDDKLYQYNLEEGEVLLLEYNEWNFNYLNQIFIFN